MLSNFEPILLTDKSKVIDAYFPQEIIECFFFSFSKLLLHCMHWVTASLSDPITMARYSRFFLTRLTTNFPHSGQASLITGIIDRPWDWTEDMAECQYTQKLNSSKIREHLQKLRTFDQKEEIHQPHILQNAIRYEHFAESIKKPSHIFWCKTLIKLWNAAHSCRNLMKEKKRDRNVLMHQKENGINFLGVEMGQLSGCCQIFLLSHTLHHHRMHQDSSRFHWNLCWTEELAESIMTHPNPNWVTNDGKWIFFVCEEFWDENCDISLRALKANSYAGCEDLRIVALLCWTGLFQENSPVLSHPLLALYFARQAFQAEQPLVFSSALPGGPPQPHGWVSP